MRHRLYVHVVWATRGRAPLLDLQRAVFLARFLPAVAQQERARVMAFGAVATHIHLVLRLHPGTSIPRLIQRLKGGSAVIASREGHGPADRPLQWAKGYNLESVSVRALPEVLEYVLRQPQHHPDQAIPGWEPSLVAITGDPVA